MGCSFNRILLYFLPVIVHLVLLPIWILSEKNGKIMFTTNLTSIESIIDFITPAFLILIYIFYPIKHEILLIFGVCVLGNLAHYLNWGVSTGLFLNPDGETVWLFQFFIIINFISIFVLRFLLKLFFRQRLI